MEALGTVDKAVDVLHALHEAGAPRGVTELSRALGLPKSSTHRLLATLSRRGLVERDGRGRYRTGMGLVALGLGALECDPLTAAARPVLEAEAEAIGETVFLVAARAGRLVVQDEAEGRGFLRAMPRVGSVVPVHATAVGKLFLAFAPERVEPDPALTRFTPATVRSARALARAVSDARRRGVAESRDEWIEGLSVVAAPVFAREVLRGAIAIAAASARLRELGFGELRARARAAARRVGERLEGRAGAGS